VRPGDAFGKITNVFKKVTPAALVEYKFVDQQYALKFSQEQQIGKLSGVFSILAIFISCIGLFGLASFVAEQRTKEIGIRKVLGATVGHLWGMLSKEFIFLVIVACVIALPISYGLMNQWLDTYDYRTELSWWIFAISCLSAIVITLITVSYQAVKAAIMNPVRSLRSE
jgi:ABC-type antimicrobial peptide transport system permease subunit